MSIATTAFRYYLVQVVFSTDVLQEASHNMDGRGIISVEVELLACDHFPKTSFVCPFLMKVERYKVTYL